MKRFIIAAVAAAASAVAVYGQQPAAPAGTAAGQKIVAVVNGETITQQKLNDLYDSMNPAMRLQYEQSGGKAAFLDYYIKKRLLVQEALKSGFDRKREVQVAMDAARDSVLFDRYVRDVVASQIVSEAAVRKYYDDHQADFQRQPMVRAWHIVMVTAGANGMPRADAADKIQRIFQKLRETAVEAQKMAPDNASQILLNAFQAAARQYSQDGTAQGGGELGWVPKGKMDPTWEGAAFATRPGTMSPVVQTPFGYHIIFISDAKPGGVAPFDEVKDTIRDRMLSEHSTEIMSAVTRLTTELRTTGKISVQTQNIE